MGRRQPFYTTARPFLGVARVGVADPGPLTGGMLGEMGAEINLRSGLKFGAELAPMTIATQGSHFDARIFLGYGGESLGLGIGLGTSLAASLRIGRFDRTYGTVRLGWATNVPAALPVDLDIAVSTRVSRRLRAGVDLGAGYGHGLMAYATGGIQYLLSGEGLHRTTLLTAGAGVSWIQLSMGPMVSLGVERRF